MFFMFFVIDGSLFTVSLYIMCVVLASFPLCQMTQEDLIQNPLLCKLLASLTQHVDPAGLTQQLRKDLEKVRLQYIYNHPL